jgi:hypothetical protein
MTNGRLAVYNEYEFQAVLNRLALLSHAPNQHATDLSH